MHVLRHLKLTNAGINKKIRLNLNLKKKYFPVYTLLKENKCSFLYHDSMIFPKQHAKD